MTEEKAKKFVLKLSGQGINIEQSIDQLMASHILQIVLGGGSAAASVPSGVAAKAETPQADGVLLSLREFLDGISASKKPDQITAIAHYVCKFEGQADFSRDDVRSRFLVAREPLPANFSRDFNVALRNGWIAEVHGKRERFYVTAKGLQMIKNNFANGKGASARR